MPLYYRDGLVAACLLIGLLVAGRLTTGVGVFVRPAAVVVGIPGAVALEALFLRYPARLLGVWERPLAVIAGVASLACLAAIAGWYAPWVLGAIVWGLVTNLVLLGCVLAGIGNPVSWLLAADSKRE